MSKKSRIQSKMNSGSKFSFNNILKVIIYLVVSRKAPNCANPWRSPYWSNADFLRLYVGQTKKNRKIIGGREKHATETLANYIFRCFDYCSTL